MEKLKMHSPNITESNIARLAELFPNCVTESRDEKGNLKKSIDFDLLRQELSTTIVEGPQERYQLNWPGKREALLTANAPIAKTLRPCREESVNFDTTQNLFIEGDNLDALKLLQETYLGKVKVIYIDPPYNTGNDFIYRDDFAEDVDEYLMKSNQEDEQGNKLIANTAANGRFHSVWLSMLYSRLKLARNLLKDDGVILISIDNGEIANIRKLCDEVFGQENFIEQIIWKKRYGGGSKEKYLVNLHEYILMYARNKLSLNEISIPNNSAFIEKYYTKRDEKYKNRGPYRLQPLEAAKSMGERKNLIYEVPCPDGKTILPQKQWLWSKERTFEALSKNELEFNKQKNGDWSVSIKQYLRDENGIENTLKVKSIIEEIYTQHGTKEIENIFGKVDYFPYPKPSTLINFLLKFSSKHGDYILDFFSGSSSSAHAVMQLNAEDNGNRKFIMVQLPEPCDEKSEAFKAGFKTIADIGKERIRRAGKKILEERELQKTQKTKSDTGNELGLFDEDHNSESAVTKKELDIGFRVLKVDFPNMANIYYNPDAVSQGHLFEMADNIKPDRSQEDLLFQVLLDWGVDLSLQISKETIGDLEVFFVDGNVLAACFVNNGEITEEFCKQLAKREPLRVVFRDSGFKSDDVKINVEQVFKLMSPHTEVKTI